MPVSPYPAAFSTASTDENISRFQVAVNHPALVNY